jgi:hypothetical protein
MGQIPGPALLSFQIPYWHGSKGLGGSPSLDYNFTILAEGRCAHHSTEPAIRLMPDIITGLTGRLGDEAYTLKICLVHLLVVQEMFHVPIKATQSLKANSIALYGDYDYCIGARIVLGRVWHDPRKTLSFF